ncbi:MAG: biopolymer transporter ExbD [Verrucomicrobiota bacterium]
MKLESSVNREPGLLHLAPLIDLTTLIVIFFILGATLVKQAGIKIDLPFSPSLIPPLAETHVISLYSSGKPSVIAFNNESMTEKALFSRLSTRQAKTRTTVVLRAEKDVDFDKVIAISNHVIREGYECILATRPDLPNLSNRKTRGTGSPDL